MDAHESGHKFFPPFFAVACGRTDPDCVRQMDVLAWFYFPLTTNLRLKPRPIFAGDFICFYMILFVNRSRQH